MLDFKEDIFKTNWNNTKEKYHHDASPSYYDCYNYYYEIECDDLDTIDENGNIVKRR